MAEAEVEAGNVRMEHETLTHHQGGGEICLHLRIYKPPAPAPSASSEKRNDGWVVVLVHQYSVLGGCQALLKGTATGLSKMGFLCVTFDMRGVKRSSGKASWTGSAEVNDVVAVCDWAHQAYPHHRLLLVGSSAGAPIAGSALDRSPGVVAYVGLGYPFGRLASILFGRHNKAVLESTKPKLFVMGTNDGFTSVKQLETKLKSGAGQARMHLVPNVGHFEMEGPDYDEMMATLIADFANTL